MARAAASAEMSGGEGCSRQLFSDGSNSWRTQINPMRCEVLPYARRMAMKILHIADGESTGGSLRQAGFRKNGDILPWRDALYTGPVPRGLTLRQLSRLRSRFWTGKSTTEFEKRDAALAPHADYEEVV